MYVVCCRPRSTLLCTASCALAVYEVIAPVCSFIPRAVLWQSPPIICCNARFPGLLPLTASRALEITVNLICCVICWIAARNPPCATVMFGRPRSTPLRTASCALAVYEVITQYAPPYRELCSGNHQRRFTSGMQAVFAPGFPVVPVNPRSGVRTLLLSSGVLWITRQ